MPYIKPRAVFRKFDVTGFDYVCFRFAQNLRFTIWGSPQTTCTEVDDATYLADYIPNESGPTPCADNATPCGFPKKQGELRHM